MAHEIGDDVAVCTLADRIELEPQVFALLQAQWPINEATRQRGLASEAIDRVLVVANGQVVGHAGMKWSTRTECLIVSVVVNKAWRRRRIGFKLMEAVEERARRRLPETTTVKLILWTEDQELFFQALGFEECEPYEGRGDANRKLEARQQSNLTRMLQAKLSQATNEDESTRSSSAVNYAWLRKILA